MCTCQLHVALSFEDLLLNVNIRDNWCKRIHLVLPSVLNMTLAYFF